MLLWDDLSYLSRILSKKRHIQHKILKFSASISLIQQWLNWWLNESSVLKGFTASVNISGGRVNEVKVPTCKFELMLNPDVFVYN